MTSRRRPTSKVAWLVVAPLLVAALVLGCASSNDTVISDSPDQTDGVASGLRPLPTPVYRFSLEDLEAGISPLEDVINNADIATATNQRVYDVDSITGINTTCPEVFHKPLLSIAQSSFGPDRSLKARRSVYLFPSEAAALDLFEALASTPEGCNTSFVSTYEELVTSNEASPFDGLDAITMGTERRFPFEEGIQIATVDHWVRLDNVVVFVQIENDSTDAAPLLSEALAFVETLAS